MSFSPEADDATLKSQMQTNAMSLETKTAFNRFRDSFWQAEADNSPTVRVCIDGFVADGAS